MLPRVTYDRILLLDLNPNPDYPHVTCVSYANSGIPAPDLDSARFNRDFRLTARDLPIYDTPGHVYFIVAKVESDCVAAEEQRATQAVNTFVAERRRAGVRLDRIPQEVVDGFKSRVQRRIPYVHVDDRADHPPPRQTGSRRRPMVSSSDPEGGAGALPGALHVSRTTLGLSGKKGARGAGRGAGAKRQRMTSPATPAIAEPPPDPLLEAPPAPLSQTLSQPASGSTSNSVLFHVPVTQSSTPAGAGVVLATEETPVVLDSELLSPQFRQVSATPRQQPNILAPARSSAHSPSPTPTPSRLTATPHPADDNVAMTKVLEKVDAMDRRIEKRHARFLESLQYLISSVDQTSKEVAEIKDSLQKISGPIMSEEVQFMAAFPLQTPTDVEDYLKKDPKLTHLIQKYVAQLTNQVVFKSSSHIHANPPYRLSEVEYDKKSYGPGLCNAILAEKLSADHYTWHSPHNQSLKPPLPESIQKAIINVASVTLRGRTETIKSLEAKIQNHFSSRKHAVICTSV